MRLETLVYSVQICSEVVWSVNSVGKMLIEGISLNQNALQPGREWELVVAPSAEYCEFADIFAGKGDASLEEIRVYADGGVSFSVKKDGKEKSYGIAINRNPVFNIIVLDDGGYQVEKYTISAEPHITSIFKYSVCWSSDIEHVCRRIDINVDHAGYMDILSID